MGRPRTPILSQSSIVSAALELVEMNGDFTMARLAALLGVRPSSLYHHVTSKSQVINLIRITWLGEVLMEVSDATRGTERLTKLMSRFYTRVSQLPALAPHLFREPLVEEESFGYYNEIVACVREMGCSRDEAAASIALIDAFVLGSAMDVTAPAFALSDVARSRHDHLDWALDRGRSTQSRGERDFIIGAEIIAAGIVARSREQSHSDLATPVPDQHNRCTEKLGAEKAPA